MVGHVDDVEATRTVESQRGCKIAGGHRTADARQEGKGAGGQVKARRRSRPRSAQARFRIATMDCAVEESQIRRAVEGIAGVRALTFNLRQRILALDAAPPVIEQALAAIRKRADSIHSRYPKRQPKPVLPARRTLTRTTTMIMRPAAPIRLQPMLPGKSPLPLPNIQPQVPAHT